MKRLMIAIVVTMTFSPLLALKIQDFRFMAGYSQGFHRAGIALDLSLAHRSGFTCGLSQRTLFPSADPVYGLEQLMVYTQFYPCAGWYWQWFESLRLTLALSGGGEWVYLSERITDPRHNLDTRYESSEWLWDGGAMLRLDWAFMGQWGASAGMIFSIVDPRRSGVFLGVFCSI